MSKAKDWKSKFKKSHEAEATAEIELNGFKFIGRRPPLDVWIRSGRMPQSLFEAMLKLQKGEIQEVSAESLGSTDTMALLRFQRDLLLYAVFEPKIVLENAGEDEVLYQDLVENEPELAEAIIAWVMKGCEGIPVKTEKGEVSVEALNGFRQKRPGGIPIGVGVNSSDVWDSPESSPVPAG
jgi:hypothetical protein